ncbi:MAG: Cof-type HAD-IIB family hydrolase [Oscillospiraceae bacterium]|nr:Cof-type HAD-IIB family hydrolase [Oscillospiraceae bacterium]
MAIKLIVSDLDGTLLDSEKRLPSDFFDVLDEVERRGITFAVASGRTYSAAEHLFPEKYRKSIALICDNGACTYLNDELVHSAPLDRAVYEEILDACDRIGGFKLVVCAAGGVYHLKNSKEFFNEVGKFYKKHAEIGDFRAIDDTIFKMAICDERGTYTHGKPRFDEIFGDRLNVQVSGEIWMDVMTAGVSKGKALNALQQRLDVSRAETMAFGDYFNDLDMLLSAEWSFCPENGHEEIKRQCRFVCADCDHGGVVESIRKYALLDEEGIKETV